MGWQWHYAGKETFTYLIQDEHIMYDTKLYIKYFWNLIFMGQQKRYQT